jgi:peroxiredoxin
VIAISVDTPSESENLRKTAGYSFLFLCDEKLDVVRKWDLVHPHARRSDAADIARPAEFLLDANGTVRWVNFTESYLVRARPQQMLDAADANHLTTK